SACLVGAGVSGPHVGNGRPPIGEHLLLLRRAALIAGRSENAANRRGNRICFGVCRVGDRQAYASEVVILVVVGISTAVFLLQIDIENRSLGVFHRMVENEYRLSRLIPPPGAGIDSPSSLIPSVDGKRD